MSVTLTGKQIKELAEIAGFKVLQYGHDINNDHDEEYIIKKCPEQGIIDEATQKIIHPDYIVTEESCDIDGECHSL